MGPLEADPAIPPTDITAEAVGPTAIRIEWEPVGRNDVVQYDIERREDLSGQFVKIAEVGVSRQGSQPDEYLDTGLDPETFYGYRVRTVLQLGRVSEPSAVAGARTAPPPGILVTTETIAPAGGDPDGYLVDITGPESRSEAIATNGSVRFSPLAPGDYTVTLSDVATGCTVQGSETQSVTVAAGGVSTIIEAPFRIDCQDPTRGVIVVQVATEGDTLPDPYTVRLTGVLASASTAVSDSSTVPAVRPPGSFVSFKNLMPGDYDVEVLDADTAVCSGSRKIAGIAVEPLSEDTASFLLNCRSFASANGGTLGRYVDERCWESRFRGQSGRDRVLGSGGGDGGQTVSGHSRGP